MLAVNAKSTYRVSSTLPKLIATVTTPPCRCSRWLWVFQL